MPKMKGLVQVEHNSLAHSIGSQNVSNGFKSDSNILKDAARLVYLYNTS